MNEPSDHHTNRDHLRDRIIGLGENSIGKNYYPQLQQRLLEVEQARNELAQSEARYRHLVENINDVIFSVGVNCEITYISPTIKSLCGWEPRQLEGQRFVQFIHPDDRVKIKACMGSSERNHSAELRFMRSDEKYIDVRFSCHWQDKSDCMIGILCDQTEIKKVQKEQENLREQLLQSQKMDSIGRLAGGVAHDFNNMLAVIMGNAELMLQQIPEGNILREDAFEILKTTRRATELTRQLLAFARKQSIEPKIIDLNDSIENTHKMIKRLLGEHIDLAWMPGKEPMPVLVDPSQPDQILTNLCVNARDAIEGQGMISIETRTVDLDETYCAAHPGEALLGKFVVLSVTDNGCGMDRQLVSNIFEPFFTTKEKDKGTGLGLSTVYGIVKQNGGFITVYSEPNQGTTFNIHLPYQSEGLPSAQKASSMKEVERGSETVLLVEDEPLLLKMTQRILEDLGYTVLSANNPVSALTLAKSYKQQIHLLLTDIIMPQMDGLELSNALMQTRPETRHLFMSGYSDTAAVRHGIVDPGIQLLQKPFSAQALSAKVREMLGEFAVKKL